MHLLNGIDFQDQFEMKDKKCVIFEKEINRIISLRNMIDVLCSAEIL